MQKNLSLVSIVTFYIYFYNTFCFLVIDIYIYIYSLNTNYIVLYVAA